MIYRNSVRLFSVLVIAGSLHASVGIPETLAEKHARLFDRTIEVLHKSAYLPGVTGEELDKAAAAAREKIVNAPSDSEFLREANTVLDRLGFSHIQLMGPETSKRTMTGKMVGLGVELRQMPDGNPEIRYVYPGSGADSINMQPGDFILEIDGLPYDPEKGASGPVGTTFSVKYRTQDGRTHIRRVVRQEFKIAKPVDARMLDETTGYLRLWSFQPYSPVEVRKGYDKIRKADRLILDLRSNGGGSVFYMMDFLAYFLKEGTTIGAFQSKGDKGEMVDRPQVIARQIRPKFAGTIILLVDGDSASASEISAAALQETGRAVLVGRKTAGKVLASTYMPVGDGFSVQIPIQDYKTIAGVRLEGTGVRPDVEVSEAQIRPAKPTDPDEAIAIARRVLSGQIKVHASRVGTGG